MQSPHYDESPSWASRIRTGECRSQSPVPYRLAIAQEGGYRDSNPGPPEPQSGALTNCAIPTIPFLFREKKRAWRDSNPRPTA